MGAHDRAVRHHTFHVDVIAEVVKHRVKDSIFTPTSETFVDTVPFTVFFGQQSPLSPALEHPQRRFHETPTVFFLADVSARMVAHELDDLPLGIS